MAHMTEDNSRGVTGAPFTFLFRSVRISGEEDELALSTVTGLAKVLFFFFLYVCVLVFSREEFSWG